jgi:hypothetical protein
MLSVVAIVAIYFVGTVLVLTFLFSDFSDRNE